ncbi:MAG: hypothetical protein AAF899_04900 [Pseudomonadota bacterium]
MSPTVIIIGGALCLVTALVLVWRVYVHARRVQRGDAEDAASTLRAAMIENIVAVLLMILGGVLLVIGAMAM